MRTIKSFDDSHSVPYYADNRSGHDIVPTVSVETPPVMLRVTHRQSGALCIPTRSVGTIKIVGFADD